MSVNGSRIKSEDFDLYPTNKLGVQNLASSTFVQASVCKPKLMRLSTCNIFLGRLTATATPNALLQLLSKLPQGPILRYHSVAELELIYQKSIIYHFPSFSKFGLFKTAFLVLMYQLIEKFLPQLLTLPDQIIIFSAFNFPSTYTFSNFSLFLYFLRNYLLIFQVGKI